MVIYFLKNKIPPKYFLMIHRMDFWKYSQAKPSEVIEFYFTKDGKLDSIQVDRINKIR